MKLNSDEKNQRHGEVLLTKVTHLLYGTIFLLIGIFVLSACGSNDETKGSTSDGSFIDRDAPKLSVSSSVLSFTEVPVGSENRQDLRISNTGVGPLHISNIRLVENDEDDLVEFHRSSNWATNLTLNRGESREISVIYRPLNNVSDSGYIELTSNDPTAPTVLVQLQTPSLAPRIFSPEVVRFNRVPAGQVARQNTEVINIGQLPLRIDDIILTGSEDFTISFPHRDSDASDHPDNDLLSWPDTLAPDSSFPVRVTFSPQSDDPSSSELIFLTNDPLKEE